MIQQYLKIKAEYQDCFLFFRLGDFYELFFEDAQRAARELEITLTSRDGGSKDRIPMCGVPYHSAENYIKTLVERGYKVAICEQVEDPKTAKGVVKREVIQLITPGTVMEGTMLQDTENNYLASIHYVENDYFAFAYTDMSTGETSVMRITRGWNGVLSEIYNRPIKEVVVESGFNEAYIKELQDKMKITVSLVDASKLSTVPNSFLEEIEDKALRHTCMILYDYIHTTQKRTIEHLKNAQYIELNEYMLLDMFSKRNLEITSSFMRKEKYGSLLWVLDRTVTAMGARKLKKWLERPLLSKESIESRLEKTEGFYEDFMQRQEIREALQSIYDLERLTGRVAFGNVNARDLIQLKNSLQKIPIIKQLLMQFSKKEIQELSKQINPLPELLDLLERSIMDDPPVSITEGNIIKSGYNKELDTYRDASTNGKKWIANLEQKEREATNIRSLKIGFNKVFGYYIEITKANLHLVPEGRYERKQTLTNAERFITEELKEKETIILEAENNMIDLEYQLFLDIREQTKRFIPYVQNLASIISEIDVLQSFATVSEENDYVRPTFSNNDTLYLEESRHPVIEKVMDSQEFVPNTIEMDNKQPILLITGPNMSGKSTYMRQLALTVLMGQIGCFVPAKKAKLSIVDQIFTRIGAADDLVSGQSTFMVEMLEANNAISHATKNSLILFDELGRGTSTYDGMALAQAIIEHIHEHIGCKTIFSTHYHELTSLEKTLSRLKNIHVRAEKINGKVVFLHQVREGAADESYGIHVAELAGLPEDLIQRASIILERLENGSSKNDPPTETKADPKSVEQVDAEQLTFFVDNKENLPSSNQKESEIIKTISNLDILEMTPMQALNCLYELNKQAKKKG